MHMPEDVKFYFLVNLFCICIFAELVLPNNSAMRRDMQESVARCHLALQQYKEATKLAQDLVCTKHNDVTSTFVIWLLNFM